MNEYRISFDLDGQRTVQRVDASTAAEAAQQIPAEADLIETKFVRAIGFSCRVRGTVGRR